MWIIYSIHPNSELNTASESTRQTCESLMLCVPNLEGSNINIVFKVVGLLNIINMFTDSICNNYEHLKCKECTRKHCVFLYRSQLSKSVDSYLRQQSLLAVDHCLLGSNSAPTDQQNMSLLQQHPQ